MGVQWQTPRSKRGGTATLSGPLPGLSVPSELSAPASGRETYLEDSSGAALHITFWTRGFLPSSGAFCGMQGKSSSRRT